MLQNSAVELPLVLVEAFSRRSHGIVEIPSSIDDAIKDATGPGKKRGLRRQSVDLQQELRIRSRSSSRGGVNILPSLDSSGNEGGQAGSKPKKVGLTTKFIGWHNPC